MSPKSVLNHLAGGERASDLVRVITADDIRSWKAHGAVRKFRRAAAQRVYSNRDVNLDHITHIGFDMDYTLAAYLRPAFDQLQYNLICRELVEKFCYPECILEWRFDEGFLIRGLLVDALRGNFVKCDAYGVILRAVHGRRRLTAEQVDAAYPAGNIASAQVGEEFQSMDTLYHLPIANLYADLVEYFDQSAEESAEGARFGDGDHGRLSFFNLWQDVRAAADRIHDHGILKNETLARLADYLPNDDAIHRMLRLLRHAGKQLFLLTNSEYWYTDAVLRFILGRFANGAEPNAGWREAFDFCIVGAQKPLFFRSGTALREIDTKSGRSMLYEVRTDQLSARPLRGRVFKGGSISAFHELAGISRGSTVLYVGDHIYADVLVARKTHHWRTLLVVPELSAEIGALARARGLLDRLGALEFLRAEMFRGLDASARQRPDEEGILQAELQKVRESIEDAFNPHFGGLFRSAHRTTLFAHQVSFFADLYTERCSNLADYPGFYYFSSAVSPRMPHEDQPYFEHEAQC
jgi:5'-nucleotidase